MAGAALLVACAVAASAGFAALAARESTSASGGTGPRADSVHANGALAGRIIEIRRSEYKNVEVGAWAQLPRNVQSRQERTTTETWATIGADGNMSQFRSTTRAGNGSVVQDQLYALGRETVNFYGWLDTDESCTQEIDVPPIGSGVPTLGRANLEAAGYQASKVPTELGFPASATALRRTDDVVVPGFKQSERTVVMSQDALDLGNVLYGITASGDRVLISYEVAAIYFHDELPAGIFQMTSLDNRPGHFPGVN
jgi:hypothetical protein